MIDLHRLLGRHNGEETEFFLRKHWLSVLPIIMSSACGLALPFITYAVIQYTTPEFLADSGRFAVFLMGASLFFLFAWVFLFLSFVDWYLDIWIVTNARIINIEQKGLFGRTTSELLLYNIQDVTSDVSGFLRSMLDYGTIEIQTSSERQRFIFEDIPHPNFIAKRILELAADQREKQTAGEFPRPTPPVTANAA